MIAQIRGEVDKKLVGSVIIDVNGVGYQVLLSEPDFEELQENETVKLYTYFHVRENSQELFGFKSLSKKELFEKLIGVNGVGPKMGMTVLSLGDERQISDAIASGNIAYITSAPGVGKRIAERITLDLKDKVVGLGGAGVMPDTPKGDDAFDALIALGYTQVDATNALGQVKSEDTEVRIKQALKVLSK